jgi:exosortase A-associated hydrolase 2
MPLAFFLDGVAGKLFCTGSLHELGQNPRRKVLIVPPFAEEMNKSRHVLAALAAAIGDAGHDVLMPDLFGTGDSAGDFSEATLATWRADLDVAIERLDPAGALELIGLRAGALLAADVTGRHEVKSMTLLQPLVDGKQQLTQMLRLRLAGGLMGGGEKETTSQLKQRLASGECLEIAGYGLSGQLAADLETLALAKCPPADVAQVHWIEVVPEPGRMLMPVSQKVIDGWRDNGVVVDSTVAVCDQFWATQEIAPCRGIIDETIKHFVS